MPRLLGGDEGRPCDHIKQSIKLFAFTTEAQRSQRGDLFVCRGSARQTKASVSNKLPSLEAGSFMENRYLPILHENISLRVLRVSNESRLTGRMGGENGFQCKLLGALGNTSISRKPRRVPACR